MRPLPKAPPASPPRRSPMQWLRIGPGLLLAIAASLYLWRQMPPQDPRPGIERTRVDIPDAPPAAPDPEWLVGQGTDLGLTADQSRRLKALQARWSSETRELRDELARASSEFERGMSADGDKRATMESLREQAGPVSTLSRQLSEARRAWWLEAQQVLTPEQRRKAEERWQARLSRPRG